MLVFAGVLGASPLASAGVSSPSPVAAPAIEACRIVPNPRVNTSFACGDLNAFPASVNVTVTFQVNVSDSTDNKMSVTFYFDYYNPNSSGGPPIVNPDSPVRTFNVSAPVVGSIVSVNTTWTYERLSNFSRGEYWVNISVRNDVGDFDPSLGSLLFPVMVNQNAAPFIDGLLSLNSVNQPLRYQNPVIPLLYENVSIGDPDADPVTVTWNWGDGTLTINKTTPLTTQLEMHVPHQYPASRFPLNESPRTVDIAVQVWIDDGVGHNVSYNSTAEFYIAFDDLPRVRIDSPTVGSVWKVGEEVPMAGNVTDGEGDPITAYWDFDNRTDSTGGGDPTKNRDVTGTTAAHAYSAPGIYNITLWATDGNKVLCLDANCTTFRMHWQNTTTPIQVRDNLPPFVALSNTTAQLGQPVVLRAAVYDPDGDNMTVRWVFDDMSPDATNVTGSSPRTSPQVFQIFQVHTYASVGNHTLTLSVFDGNATVNDSKMVFVQSFNQPPVILAVRVRRADGTSAGNDTFRINETVIINVVAYDPESDTLNVSIDWGDGVSGNRTEDPRTASNCSLDNLSRNTCSVSFSHAYPSIGSEQFREYPVLVTITDNQVYLQYDATTGVWITLDHTKNQTVTLLITNFPPPPTYQVSFRETGLPTGTSWSVTLGGTTHTSATSTIVFTEDNGTYGYAIGPEPGYTTASYVGSIEVQGAAVAQTVAWTEVTYHVTFEESGLPPSTSWSATLRGTAHSSTTTMVEFVEPNGTYSYTVSSVPGYMDTPASGTITVNGYDVTKAITFSIARSAPTISTFSASPSTITLGSSVRFTVTATGGTGGLTYAYADLPSGCSSGNVSALTCTPTATGGFTITVTVTDVAGQSATATVELIVNPTPTSATTIFGLDPPVFFGATAFVIAIAVAGAVLTIRRKKRAFR